jgi:hypothetical protein
VSMWLIVEGSPRIWRGWFRPERRRGSTIFGPAPIASITRPRSGWEVWTALLDLLNPWHFLRSREGTYMRLIDLVPILQMAVGPVILIPGMGLLLLSMRNRRLPGSASFEWPKFSWRRRLVITARHAVSRLVFSNITCFESCVISPAKGDPMLLPRRKEQRWLNNSNPRVISGWSPTNIGRHHDRRM